MFSNQHVSNRNVPMIDIRLRVLRTDLTLAPPVKDSWIFYNINDDINKIAPNVWQTSIHCYELYDFYL